MGIRVANALAYLALAVFAVASVAEPLGASFRALVQPYARAPALEWPWWWLALGGTTALLVFELARRLAQGRRPGLARYGALLLTCALSVASRQILKASVRVDATEGLAHLVARTQIAADAAFARDRRYPSSADVLAADFPESLRDLGFFARGARRLPTRVVVVSDAQEPVLRAPDGVRPGDVVFAVDDTRQRFWITSFTLDRRGRVGVTTGPGGRALVSAGAFGRTASRLDTLFPDYPRQKLPGRPAAPPSPP